MRIYAFAEDDQREANWLIHRDKSNGIGFEPVPDYSAFFCPKCRKFSHDEVFEFGFPANCKLKLRGDIAGTLDGFICVNDKVVHLIEANKFLRLRYKKVDPRGWYVINITTRFQVTAGTYQVVRGPCEACGRNREIILGVRHLGQLMEKPQAECIFSTVADWECSRLDDRSMFLTGGVLDCFRQNGIKGGAARLVHSVEEEARMQLELKNKGTCKYPKGSTVVL